tara:strand:+ start:4029 stop:4553 length:525 start_codon:yes stop_codon:yes gene_type:complete
MTRALFCDYRTNTLKCRNNWKKRNTSKEKNEDNLLKTKRCVDQRSSFNKFLDDEYGIKVNSFFKRRWNCDGPLMGYNEFQQHKLYSSMYDEFQQNSSLPLYQKKYFENRRNMSLGNIPHETLMKSYPQIVRDYNKRGSVDEHYHRDQTRWDKNKSKTKQRKAAREFKRKTKEYY